MPVRTAFLWLVVLSACADVSGDTGGDAGDDTGSTDSTGDTTGEAPPDFDSEIQPILESACLCHFTPTAGGDMSAPYLNLNLGLAVGELVDVDSVQVPSMKRVAPGELANSYLVHKLRGTHVDVGGPVDTNPMPPLAPLADDEIALIEAWIVAGAGP